MRLGIMAATFARPTLEATLDALAACGVQSVQLDLACAGVPTLPAQMSPALCARVRAAFAARGLTMEALSGTLNMIDPDPRERAEGLRRLRVLLDACGALGTTIVTLRTGTRDPLHNRHRHPDNDTPGAWTDFVAGMREAVRGAEAAGVTLAFEPEVADVVDSAQKARQLLDEIGSPWLKVVLDGANIFHSGEPPRMRAMLEEAFALSCPDIALAHAKDLDHDGEAGHLPAGRGLLDNPLYLTLLQRSGFTGALILHGLAEGGRGGVPGLCPRCGAPGALTMGRRGPHGRRAEMRTEGLRGHALCGPLALRGAEPRMTLRAPAGGLTCGLAPVQPAVHTTPLPSA